MTRAVKLPHARLSGFYLFYFAILGILLPFWPLYLSDIGLSVAEIGTLMAVLMMTRIVSPMLWGRIGDRVPRRMRVVQWGSLAAAICFAGVFLRSDYYWLLWIVAGYSFFWNAVLPQFEVVTLRYLGDQHHRYSQIRAWGSVGFITAAMGLGWYFDLASISHVPLMLLVCFVALWLLAASIPGVEESTGKSRAAPSISSLLNKNVIGFMVAGLLMQLAHGPYYTYFSLFVEGAGYSKQATGFYWALGAISETLLFLVMHKILPKTGTYRLFQLALWCSVARWLLLDYWVSSATALFFIQIMHAGTFGAFHAASIDFLRRYVPEGLSGQGQALYSMFCYGVGGALGSLLSAWLWPLSPTYAFAMASGVSVLAVIIAYMTMNKS
jgi:PPP family 3-phenylpropionic acid transporter